MSGVSNWRPKLHFEWSLFTDAAAAWSAHNAQRLGAALAYYTVFSLAPLLLIFVSIAGMVFGDQAARGELYWQIRAVAGHESALFIQQLLKDARIHATSGILATVFGFGVLILGASGVFAELRDDLNFIWDVPAAPRESLLRGMLRYELHSFGLVIGSGLLITLSLAASIAIQAGEKYALAYITVPVYVLEAGSFAITFFATTFLFGLVYTIVPERRVPWTDAAVGSLVTAILFTAGKSLVAVYLGRAGVGSLYGAASSLIVLLAWVYYSSQIFLFGAEFTHVYSQRHGVIGKERGQAQIVQIDTSAPAGRR
jgi:membrane protein